MKHTISIFALLLFVFSGSYSYIFSAPVSDGCLRMYVPDEHGKDTSLGGTWYGSFNPDSVMIDTCSGSSTYNHLYAKKWFFIQFPKYFYPFSHILNSSEVKGVSDIDSIHIGMLTRFLGLQDTLGSFYFQGFDNPPSDSIIMLNPFIRIVFANYQDIEFIKSHFKNSVDSIKDIYYQLRVGQLTDVQELQEQQSAVIYPNPVKDYIVIQQDYSGNYRGNIEVFEVNGKMIMESEYKDRIDVSQLHSGSYFLRINHQTIKFIKE